MQLDRTLTPEAFPLLPHRLSADDLPLPFSKLIPVTTSLPNGIEVTLVEDSQSELLRVEVLLNAGIEHQTQPLQAQLCAMMLKEGSENQSGESIAETFDFHGAYSSAGALTDYSMVSIVMLKRHFRHVFPTFSEMITRPVFPEKAFHRIVEERRQEFVINREKPAFEARRNLMNRVFENGHPYGVLVVEEDYKRLTIESLKDFHGKHYLKQGIRLVLTGAFDSDIIAQVADSIGSIPLSPAETNHAASLKMGNGQTGEYLIPMPEAIQSAVRVGCLTIGMNHPDFIPLQIAVNLLGGYFGSRLNQNLREDKGYTYGIGAGLIPMRGASVFTIGAEVEASVTHEAIQAINHEIVRLSQEAPSDEELKQTVGYLAGSFLRSIDGSFALADRIKSAADCGLDHRFYVDYLNTLNTITPGTITTMAGKYLDPQRMVVVRVGK